jgi:hypothetical protein
MPVDLRVVVKKALVHLRKDISKKHSELASLRTQLIRYQRVQGLLNGAPGAAAMKLNGKVRRKRVDWASVLKRLPGSFNIENVNSAANSTSPTYAYRVLGSWIKHKKIKRVERGLYQKL